MAGERTDADYEIESLSKGLAVLEALSTPTGEPVPMKRVIERTELPYDTVMRTLKTLRLRGYVKEDCGKWSYGHRFLTVAAGLVKSRI
ncbi:MAG: helix-turn-helix domain-containing protein [Pyrinomonadaceae bacterium]